MASSNNYSIYVDVLFDEKEIQRRLNQISKGSTIRFDVEGDAADDLGKISKASEDTSDSIESLGLTYQQANMIMRESIEIISSMVEQVYELNSAQTEFKKVSELSGKALDDYTNKLADMGAEVARTGKPNRSEPECTDGKRALRTPRNPVKPKAFVPQRKDETNLSVKVGNH